MQAALTADGYYMQEFNKQKIFWHSRRGMLELDLLLAPFAQEVFETLTYEDQLLYSDLLEQEDQDLFSWLLGRQVPADERFGPIIAKILAHKQKPA
ncbi:MAG: succinate dehydrogenase assembly factor 2 [Pseudohongiellaceae bacterium]|jgi:antitoxin CptB|tara:strand:+ start:886 stop:1173 length:288 start_codon:yes stop_codon:yes gene_type:complete